MSSSSFPKPARRRSPELPQEKRQNDTFKNNASTDTEHTHGAPKTTKKRGAIRSQKKRHTQRALADAALSRHDYLTADPRQEKPARHPNGSHEPREERTRAQASDDALLLPGIKPVLELVTASPEQVDAVFIRKGRHGKDADAILDRCREAGVRFSLLDSEQFSRIYTGNSQGVVARLYEAGFIDFETLLDSVMDAPLPLLVVLDQVQDPGNAGTLARTLYSLGGAGLIVPKHNGVYLGAAAAKAAAGALASLPVAKVGSLGQALDTAKKRGFTIYGAKSDGLEAQGSIPTANVFELSPFFPAILVLGSEESGIREGVAKRCDTFLRIPMARSFDSLNVAQAGAIIIGWLSHAASQKQSKKNE